MPDPDTASRCWIPDAVYMEMGLKGLFPYTRHLDAASACGGSILVQEFGGLDLRF